MIKCANLNCNHYFWYGEAKYPSKYYWGLICQKCSEKESGLMNELNNAAICKCGRCGKISVMKEMRKVGGCPKCGTGGNFLIIDNGEQTMPNIKITAEVDGKQVPLETVSTETFEAIKALEKPKEIPVPVARVGNWSGNLGCRRLFLKITDNIRNNIACSDIDVIAIDLGDGFVKNTWTKDDIENLDHLYENIKPL